MELHVLDLATGTGLLAGAFSERGHTVSGLGFADKLLKRARRRFPQVDFRHFDLLHLDQLETNSHDLVCMGYFLHGLSPDFRRYVLRESARIAFDRSDDEFCLRQEYRSSVWFLAQDIRQDFPDGRFDLVLCRNLVFTYFQAPLQTVIAKRLAEVLVPCGLLLLGSHESLPAAVPGLTQERPWLYRRDMT